RVAARVVGHPLADEADPSPDRSRRAIDEVDEARRLGAASPDGEQKAEPLALQGRLVLDRALEAVPLRDLLRLVGKERGGAAPRVLVGEIARNAHGLGERDPPLDAGRLVPRADDGEATKAGCAVLFLAARLVGV